MLDKILEWFPREDFFFIEGFDRAIIGIDDETMRLIYSVSKVIEILSEEMSEEDAVDVFFCDIKQCHFGERTPIWCTDHL